MAKAYVSVIMIPCNCDCVAQVVAVPHDRIVNLLATSVGEVSLRCQPLIQSTHCYIFVKTTDIDENDADIDVQAIDRTGNACLYVMRSEQSIRNMIWDNLVRIRPKSRAFCGTIALCSPPFDHRFTIDIFTERLALLYDSNGRPKP